MKKWGADPNGKECKKRKMKEEEKHINAARKSKHAPERKYTGGIPLSDCSVYGVYIFSWEDEDSRTPDE